MQGRHRFEPYMAVDAGTAVPTTVRLFAIVHLHDNLVLAPVLIKIWCHINHKRCIAVVMLSSLLSVHKDFGLLIHALEVELDQFISQL